MRVRLVRHVSGSGRIRELATSLCEHLASVAELTDLCHGRWRIEEPFNRLRHRLAVKSVSDLSSYALLVDVAAKLLADNLTALLNRSVALPEQADARGRDAQVQPRTGAVHAFALHRTFAARRGGHCANRS